MSPSVRSFSRGRPSATPPRDRDASTQALRVALVWRGTVLHERLVRGGRVAFGPAGLAESLPDPAGWIDVVGGRAVIDCPADAQVRVLDGDGQTTFSGHGTPPPLAPGACAIVSLGDTAIFAQWVSPGALPSAGWAMDYNLAASTLASAGAHAAVVVVAFLFAEPHFVAAPLDLNDRIVQIFVDEPPADDEETPPPEETPTEGGEASAAGSAGAEADDDTPAEANGTASDVQSGDSDPDLTGTTEVGSALETVEALDGQLVRVFGDGTNHNDVFGVHFDTAGAGEGYAGRSGAGGIGGGSRSRGGHGVGEGFGGVHEVGGIGGGGDGDGVGGRIERRPAHERARVIDRTPSISAGFLSAEAIQRVVRRHRRGMRYCYERELVGHPELAGSITAEWTIGLDGRVMSATIGSDSLGSEAVSSCILQEIRRMRFDQPDGGMVSVSYPLRFDTAE